MKKTLISAILAASAASAMALPALDIDFTSNAWSGANAGGGQASFSGTPGVTAYAFKVAGLAPSDLNAGQAGKLTWELGDGLGVSDIGPNELYEEIDGTESILVRFLNGAGNGINGIALTDIFLDADGTGNVNGGNTDEIGKAWYDDGSIGSLQLDAQNAGGNGEAYIPLNPAKNLLWVEFYSGNPNSRADDYSVAGFTKVGVPDAGSTLALMGLAMIGVGAVRRTVRR